MRKKGIEHHLVIVTCILLSCAIAFVMTFLSVSPDDEPAILQSFNLASSYNRNATVSTIKKALDEYEKDSPLPDSLLPGNILDDSKLDMAGSSSYIPIRIEADTLKLKDALMKIPHMSEEKAMSMALAYQTIMETHSGAYASNFGVGVMANVMHEGNIGQIEKVNKFSYWNLVTDDVKKIAGTTLDSQSKVSTLLEGVPADVSGVGIGFIQWSYPTRRIPLLKMYEELGSAISNPDARIAVEVKYLATELSADGGYFKKLKEHLGENWESATAEAWSRAITIRYEVPNNATESADKRALRIPEILDALRSVSQ